MIVTSIKAPNEILTWPPTFWPLQPSLESYVEVMDAIPIGQMYFNSIFIAVITTAGQILFSSTSAFAFAKLRFKGRNVLFTAYLATMMVPVMVTLIPRYVIMADLKLVNTHASVILPILFDASNAAYGSGCHRRSRISKNIFPDLFSVDKAGSLHSGNFLLYGFLERFPLAADYVAKHAVKDTSDWTCFFPRALWGRV